MPLPPHRRVRWSHSPHQWVRAGRASSWRTRTRQGPPCTLPGRSRRTARGSARGIALPLPDCVVSRAESWGAMERLRAGFIAGYQFVAEFDIRNFFGEIDHDRQPWPGLRGGDDHRGSGDDGSAAQNGTSSRRMFPPRGVEHLGDRGRVLREFLSRPERRRCGRPSPARRRQSLPSHVRVLAPGNTVRGCQDDRSCLRDQRQPAPEDVEERDGDDRERKPSSTGAQPGRYEPGENQAASVRPDAQRRAASALSTARLRSPLVAR
jgi:hypothetical protein